MADLRHISHALSQYGRNGDTQLVHMHPAEVALLHSITPKGLTKNPDTGLPEAFNFMDLLGPIAGIGAAIFAPELLPFIAGAAGIGTYAATGDLGKGIMAGLGSYGAGAGAGALGAGGLFSSGAAGAGEALGGGDFIGTGIGSAPMSTITGEAANSAAAAYGTAAPSMGMAGSLGAVAPNEAALAQSATSGLGGMGGASMAAQAAPAANYAAMDTPFQAAAPAAHAGGLGGVGNWISDHPMTSVGGLMALSSLAPQGNNYPSIAVDQQKGPSQPLVQGPVPRPAYMPAGYHPGGPEAMYFPQGVGAAGGLQPPGYAAGGEVEQQMDPGMASQLIGEAKAAIMGQSQDPQGAIQRFVQVFGQDALQQLAQSVTGAGGAVQGAGDGTSDSVPGTIDGTQPVQLATDEHVLPADVVSGIGNGSSAAGHRALKAMTRRVRTARSNGGSMPRSVEAHRILPA